MKKLSPYLLIVFLLIIYTDLCHSAIKKVAQTGLQFLKIDMSARAAAMGGAFGMVGFDANAMFYNPSGIGKMESNLDVFITRTEWAADISYNAGALVKNLGTFGNLGFSFISADYGDIIGTRVSSAGKGYIDTGLIEDVGAYAFGFAYARAMTDKFTVGGQIKYAFQRLSSSLLSNNIIASNRVSGLAYDFGTMFYPGFKSFRMGMNIKNFSPQFKYQNEAFELPLTFVISVAMDVLDFLGEEHPNSLLIAVDAIHPRDYTERIHLGGEYLYKNMFAIRAGYKLNYDEEGFCAGFGVKRSVSGVNIKLDYAYSDIGVFNTGNRISIGFTLE